MLAIGSFAGKFGADDCNNARQGIAKVIDGVEDNRNGVWKETNGCFKTDKNRVRADTEKAGFNDDFFTMGFHDGSFLVGYLIDI